MSNLITKTVQVFPMRQGAIFQAGDEINFYLPESLGLLNPDSYLRFNLKMKGNLKKAPALSAGAASIISSVVVMSGDGRTIYETLDNYAVKAGLYYHYSENEGSKSLRVLHEGKTLRNVIEGDELKTAASASNQYIDANATTTAGWAKNVEVCLPLWCSGVLSPMRQKVFPLLATGGLRIRITLNSVKDATEVLYAPIYAGTENEVPTKNSYGRSGGAYANARVSGSCSVGVLAVDRPIEVVQVGNTDADTGRLGGAGMTEVAHPYVVGQTININGGIGDRTITAINIDGDGKVALSVSGGVIPNGQYMWSIKTDDTSNPNEGFEVSNLSFVAGVVVPDSDYISAIQQGIAKGKMIIDIHTYQNYPVNLTANSKQNALYIKSINSRAKALLSVPLVNSTSEGYTDDNFKPDIQNLESVQYYLYGTLTPNRKTSYKEFQVLNNAGALDEAAGSFSGQGIREMEHAFSAAGYPVNNLLNAWEYPFIGRRLSPGKGYSMPLNLEGDVRLNMTFDSKAGPSAGIVHNFVEHIRRITISGNNQEVTL